MKKWTALALAGLVWQGAAGSSFVWAEAAVPTAAVEASDDEGDARLAFLATQLASVETSLEAVDRLVRRTAHQKGIKKGDAEQFRYNNELMDRKGGGPVRWEAFYGKTARQVDGRPRPRQFDYIYRANDDRQRLAEQEAAGLGGKAEALIARRRQLEAEQSALWARMGLHAVSGQRLAAKPIYRFDLAATDAGSEPRAAARAACEFIRAANRAASNVQESLDGNQAKAYADLQRVTQAAYSQLEARLVALPGLALQVGDSKTPVGKVAATARRLADVSKNIADAHRLALEGDQANDDQRKDIFRAQLQEMLATYGDLLLEADRMVTELITQWALAPDPQAPIDSGGLRSRSDTSFAPPAVATDPASAPVAASPVASAKPAPRTAPRAAASAPRPTEPVIMPTLYVDGDHHVGESARIEPGAVNSANWQRAIAELANKQMFNGHTRISLVRVVLEGASTATELGVGGTKVSNPGEGRGGGAGRKIQNGDLVVVQHTRPGGYRGGKDPLYIGSYPNYATTIWVEVPPPGTLGVVGDVVVSPYPETQKGRVVVTVVSDGPTIRSARLNHARAYTSGMMTASANSTFDSGRVAPGEYRVSLPDLHARIPWPTVTVMPGLTTQLKIAVRSAEQVEVLETTTAP